MIIGILARSVSIDSFPLPPTLCPFRDAVARRSKTCNSSNRRIVQWMYLVILADLSAVSVPWSFLRVLSYCYSGTYIAITGHFEKCGSAKNNGCVQNLHLLGTPSAAKARCANDAASLLWLRAGPRKPVLDRLGRGDSDSFPTDDQRLLSGSCLLCPGHWRRMA